MTLNNFYLFCFLFIPLQMCCFPVFQQFGLLFADRMKSIELSASQITTIINLNACLKSCIGRYVRVGSARYNIRLGPARMLSSHARAAYIFNIHVFHAICDIFLFENGKLKFFRFRCRNVCRRSRKWTDVSEIHLSSSWAVRCPSDCIVHSTDDIFELIHHLLANILCTLR